MYAFNSIYVCIQFNICMHSIRYMCAFNSIYVCIQFNICTYSIQYMYVFNMRSIFKLGMHENNRVSRLC